VGRHPRRAAAGVPAREGRAHRPAHRGDRARDRHPARRTGHRRERWRVWIANRAAPSVTRLDARTGELKTARTGRGPAALAIGDGAVWVANAEESTVSRINRADPGDAATIAVPGSPRGVAFGGGSLWATSFASSTLTRIDGDTGRATGDPLELALNPTKLTVSRGAVYVVSPAGGELQRVRFGRAR
jgi:streptogramin lyase